MSALILATVLPGRGVFSSFPRWSGRANSATRGLVKAMRLFSAGTGVAVRLLVTARARRKGSPRFVEWARRKRRNPFEKAHYGHNAQVDLRLAQSERLRKADAWAVAAEALADNPRHWNGQDSPRRAHGSSELEIRQPRGIRRLQERAFHTRRARRSRDRYLD